MKQGHSSWEFEKFGTKWSIETKRPLRPETCRAVMERLDSFDRAYSRFRSDSLVASMKEQPGTFLMPRDFSLLFHLYQRLYRLTNRKMTPLIGEMLERAGYDATYSLAPREALGNVPDLLTAVSLDVNTLSTTCPVTLDIGAAGKGYAVDLIAEIIEKETRSYVIDASGDIRHRGRKEDRIGLEHPLDPSKVIGVVSLNNCSLCASASNRRVWRDMHHIIDPIARRPIEKILATWVIASDTLHADALATALFFVDEPDALLSEFSFEFVRMFHDGTVDYSPGFGGELFI